MPADALIVLLEGRPVGRIERTAGGALRFDYDTGIDPVATPLSVSMPQAVRRHGDARIAPWLWGLLPDDQWSPSVLAAHMAMSLTRSMRVRSSIGEGSKP